MTRAWLLIGCAWALNVVAWSTEVADELLYGSAIVLFVWAVARSIRLLIRSRCRARKTGAR